MLKSSSLLLGTLAVVFFATPAFATPPSSYSSREKAAAVMCVSGAVTNREVAIANAVTEYTQAISGAYSKRQAYLGQVYGASSETDPKVLKKNVKDAWTSFRTLSKSATANWKKAKADIWKAFKTETKACKDTVNTSDAAYMSYEL